MARKTYTVAPDWVVLYHFMVNNDLRGLQLVDRRLFAGTAADVHELLCSLKALSLPTCEVAIRTRFDHDVALSVLKSLQLVRAQYDDTPITVSEHIDALKYRYGLEHVRNTVTDAAEKIRKAKDPYAVAHALRQQLDLSDLSLIRARSLADVLRDAAGREDVLTPTGIPQLATLGITEWFMGNFVTIGGPSGSFKTTFTIDLMVRALIENPRLHAIYFSKEQPAHEIVYKLVARFSKTPYWDVQRTYNGGHPEAIERMHRELGQHPQARSVWQRFKVIDYRDFNTAGHVCDAVRSYAAQMPAGAMLTWAVDYLSRLAFDGMRNDAVVDALNALKDTAQTTNSLAFVLSQLKKDWDTENGRRVKAGFATPQRGDLIWSSELPNLSAYLLLLIRPGETMPSLPREFLFVNVDKARFKDTKARMVFRLNGDRQQFESLIESEEDMVRTALKVTKKS